MGHQLRRGQKSFCADHEDQAPLPIVGYAYVHWNVFGIPACPGTGRGASRKHAGRQRGGPQRRPWLASQACPPAGNGAPLQLHALLRLEHASALGIDANRPWRKADFERLYLNSIVQRWRCRPVQPAEARTPCVDDPGRARRLRRREALVWLSPPGWLRRRWLPPAARQHRRPDWTSRGSPESSSTSTWPAPRPTSRHQRAGDTGRRGAYSSQRGMANSGAHSHHATPAFGSRRSASPSRPWR